MMFYRKNLGHDDVPQKYVWSCQFSVTICVLPRYQNHLCRYPVGPGVLSSALHYQQLEKWRISLLLLMPDHAHLVVTPCLGYALTELIVGWKRYLTRTYHLSFQRDFFDHRIRNTESFNAHCRYIRWNPARAGLVKSPEDWEWVYPSLEDRYDGFVAPVQG